MSDKKYCFDCKHCIQDRFLLYRLVDLVFRTKFSYEFAKCRKAVRDIELVTGKVSYSYCSTQRAFSCDTDAKHFEKKGS